MSEAELAPAPQESRCSDHPERLARGTCERCGRFTCPECAQAGIGLRCAACVRQLIGAVPPGIARARWATWFLYAYAALSSVGTLLVAPFVTLLLAQRVSTKAITTALTTQAFSAAAFNATLIALYLRWLHRAVRQAQVLGVDAGATPGWAVGYWFVPFINVFRPYQVVSRLAAGVGARFPAGLLGAWWTLCLLTFALNWRDSNAGLGSPAVRFAAKMASALAALACAGVLNGIERGIAERRASFGPAEPGSSLPTASQRG